MSPRSTRSPSSSPLLLLVALLVAVGAVLVAGQSGSRRNISDADLDRILRNPSITTYYINCLLGKGSCDRDGRELKSSIPMALMSECSKCSDNQKRATERVIRHLRAKRPDDWRKLTARYDPNGEYEKRFAAVTAPTATRKH